MHNISLIVGKSTIYLLKLLKRRGAALPGLVVEKLDPGFMAHMLKQLPEGVVVISGTNGKTTSTKMLTAILQGSGKRVLTNPTGSNFTRGIVASVVAHSSWSGKLDYDIAVIELDEAYAAKFVQLVKPRASLILNVMRDQMDRFGEIDYTAKLLRSVVAVTTEHIVLNRDDPRVFALAESNKNEPLLYGVDAKLRDVFRNDDELHDKFSPKKASVPARVELKAVDDSWITIRIDGKNYKYSLALYGLYNAQNATAVTAMCISLGMNPVDVGNYIATVKPAFGRGERITNGDQTIILQLVKNPSGFRHAILGASAISEDYNLIAINDDYADGRDVSWLWDVDFKSLAGKQVATSGVRATDMTVRLKYDEISVEATEPDLATALKSALLKTGPSGTLHIYTTYTAMLKLRQLISQFTEVEKI